MVWAPYILSIIILITSVCLLLKRRSPRGAAIALCGTLLWTAVIFSFSMQDAELSAKTSHGFAKVISEVLDAIRVDADKKSFWEENVRALAHIYEFLVLGMIAYTAGRMLAPAKPIYPLVILYGAAVPVLDECVQLGSDGRAFQLIDMIKDWSGFTIGALIAFVLYAIIHKKRGGSTWNKSLKKPGRP